MVKMAAGAMVFCAALFLVLPSASAVQKINSISDLRRISSDTSVSRQTIMLLNWFAQTVGIKNGVIHLTFDPLEDYGSHHYGNYDGLLNSLPRGYTYYTVGNIHEDKQRQLPRHIRDFGSTDYDGNRARIIFRVHRRNFGHQRTWQVIDEVYITQHYGHEGTEYDPRHTYQINLNLLREIREFPMRGDNNLLRILRRQHGQHVDDNQLTSIQNHWQDLACLGLLLFIVVQHIRINDQSYNMPKYYTLQSGFSQPQTDTCWNCCLVLFFILLVVMIAFVSFLINKT